MAIAYSVAATVVDVKTDTPKPADVFFIDSNVWFWLTYTRSSLGNNPPRYNQPRVYPDYIKKALGAKSKLLQCGLSFSELAHRIEATEFEIFQRTHAGIFSKEYRHNYAVERKQVVAEIQSAWGQVSTIANELDILIDKGTTGSALSNVASLPIDAYDSFFIEAIRKSGVVQVITDDGDYATVPGIQMFTSNQGVLNAARQQGKVVTR